jgi:Na+-driven multidrug efflux pump
MNISSTVSNLFFCAFFAMGTTVSIVVGQHLGAGRLQQAVEEDRKLIAFAVALCCTVGVVMALISPLIPQLYNTTDVVRHLAEELLIVTSIMMPFFGFTNACYFTLRSGGKTIITFLFDSAFVWGVCIPLAFILSRYTGLAILPMYVLVQSLELIKCITGFFLVKSKRWVNNLVNEI